MTVDPRVSATPVSELTHVTVRGARQNNLKDVSLDLPRNAIVAFTGVSGSGKSSLAFGTLFAESQRRYLESVAPYARRLIDQVGTPDVDLVEGMPPAVALQQQRTGGGARSDVSTVTTLSSVVRMLYSRAGWYPADQGMLYAEDFSANTVQGACPTCHGIGRVYEVTEKQLVPDPTKTIRDRAVAAWPPAWQGQNLRDILVSMGYDVDTPWQDLKKKDREWILFTEERPTVPVWAGLTPKQTKRAKKEGLEPSYQGTFIGARKYVLDTFATTKSNTVKKRVSQFISSVPCPECGGKKIKGEALRVTFEGYDIAELSALPMEQVARLAERASQSDWRPAESADDPDSPNLAPSRLSAAHLLAGDAANRLKPIIDLGLGYLSLDRATPTLSGGERQRLRLATQLASKLFGVVYVLDEPSAGLHPRDLDALIGILHGLKERGNSVFIVEHSLAVIREADWLVDIGPGAGERGGQVLYSGEPSGLAAVEQSVTRRYLFGADAADHSPRFTGNIDEPRREARGWLEATGVVRNNIDGIDVRLPLGCLTAVTGVSGAGKSSLVSQALPKLLADALGQKGGDLTEDEPSDDNLLLTEDQGVLRGHVSAPAEVRRVVAIDQKSIGRTPRSNVATYTGLFDEVRKLFAKTPEAKKRHYSASRFSFNVAAGRCPTCEGEGSLMVELLFLPSVYTPCPDCHGTRYKASTLEVTWNGATIADVLAMSVDEAAEFFANEPRVELPLSVLQDVGLGYLRLDQPAPELSGGEAQRVKLAAELQRANRGDTLYVLDEPTAGLHPSDSDRLMAHLQGLVDAGNTVVIAELDMRIVAQADYVIDMGPGAGRAGGQIVTTGTPSEVCEASDSASAPYLRRALLG